MLVMTGMNYTSPAVATRPGGVRQRRVGVTRFLSPIVNVEHSTSPASLRRQNAHRNRKVSAPVLASSPVGLCPKPGNLAPKPLLRLNGRKVSEAVEWCRSCWAQQQQEPRPQPLNRSRLSCSASPTPAARLAVQGLAVVYHSLWVQSKSTPDLKHSGSASPVLPPRHKQKVKWKWKKARSEPCLRCEKNCPWRRISSPAQVEHEAASSVTKPTICVQPKETIYDRAALQELVRYGRLSAVIGSCTSKGNSTSEWDSSLSLLANALLRYPHRFTLHFRLHQVSDLLRSVAINLTGLQLRSFAPCSTRMLVNVHVRRECSNIEYRGSPRLTLRALVSSPKVILPFPGELVELEPLLHWPEEVALAIWRQDRYLFEQLNPVDLLRFLTCNLTSLTSCHGVPNAGTTTTSTPASPPASPSPLPPLTATFPSHQREDIGTLWNLIKRFTELSRWITHLIVSPASHEQRKAVLSYLLRLAQTSWTLGNFQGAAAIVAGLKSEQLKPFWLSLRDKLPEGIPLLEFLATHLYTSSPTSVYQSALQAAKDRDPSCVVPFWGFFLHDLKCIVSQKPSLFVVKENLSVVADYNGENDFVERVEGGGLMNPETLEQIQNVMDTVKKFHAKSSGTAQSMPRNPVVFMDLTSGSEGLDPNSIHVLQEGITVLHADMAASRCVPVLLQFDEHLGHLVWSASPWASQQAHHRLVWECQLPDEYDDVIRPPRVPPVGHLKYAAGGTTTASTDESSYLEQGYVDLQKLQDAYVSSREEMQTWLKKYHQQQLQCLTVVYGSFIGDSKVRVFLCPARVGKLWLRALQLVLHKGQHVKEQHEQAAVTTWWLKDQYLALYYANGMCRGPSTEQAIEVFSSRLTTGDWSLPIENEIRKKKSVAVSSSPIPIETPKPWPKASHLDTPVTDTSDFSSLPTLSTTPTKERRMWAGSCENLQIRSRGKQRRLGVRGHRPVRRSCVQLEDTLRYQDFCSVYENYRLSLRNDLQGIFAKWATPTPFNITSICLTLGQSSPPATVLTLENFIKFLQVEQHETLTPAAVQQLIQRREPHAIVRSHGCLSYEGFVQYLSHESNVAYLPETRKEHNMSMDQPLSHYYIASSHNTYLTGHQLKGESSADVYSQVLLTGCRCVELDCWDGDDGPLIYHGHTLTTKVPLLPVVEAIARHAFTVSPYPVILSIENHCSIAQQQTMAAIFQRVLGDRLVSRFLFESDFTEEARLPSPAQLKHRFLIKNKKLVVAIPPLIKTTLGGSGDSPSEGTDPESSKSFKKRPLKKSLSQGGRSDSISSQDSGKNTMSQFVASQSQSPSHRKSPSRLEYSSSCPPPLDDDLVDGFARRKKVQTQPQIAPELSALVTYCQATKFREFKPLPLRPPTVVVVNTLPVTSTTITPATSSSSCGSSATVFECCSINENTAKKLCRKQPVTVVAHTETQLIRTYPAAMRIDSSNFNPVFFWAVGIQMVALNYQTQDSALHINQAFFQSKGNTGYVLKPALMWDRGNVMYRRFNPWNKVFDGIHAWQLQLTIISGQFLCPNPNGNPIIDIEIIGVPVDSVKHKTRLVPRNALNPVFNETFQFTIAFLDLAFLRVCVTDLSTNTVTAQRVVPVKDLRSGYRHLPLCNLMNQVLPLASLCIQSSLEEETLATPAETSVPVADSPQIKRKMFFLVIDTRSLALATGTEQVIIKVTQECTAADGIRQSLAKCMLPPQENRFQNYLLLEEVNRGWDEANKLVPPVQRVLAQEERLLEAQSRWTGEGKFILKKIVEDPSFRAWLSSVKGKYPTVSLDFDSDLDGSEERFLVCVHNVSPEIPYAILKSSVTATAREVLFQALSKSRQSADEFWQYVLVEERDQQRRVMADDEIVYQTQARWATTGRFCIERSSKMLGGINGSDTVLKKLAIFRASSLFSKKVKNSPKVQVKEMYSDPGFIGSTHHPDVVGDKSSPLLNEQSRAQSELQLNQDKSSVFLRRLKFLR